MMNVIFGSSGLAKEIEWFLYDLSNRGYHSYKPQYFVSKIDIGNAIQGIEVISEETFEEKIIPHHDLINVFIGIGSPTIKEKIFNKLSVYPHINYPNIIHHNASLDNRSGGVIMGKGNVICPGSVLTTNIKIGDFTLTYLDCTVGHDTIIGNFTTISPGCQISGNVTIGCNVFIGAGAVVLERLSICDNAIIGAGAVVTKSITEAGTYVGVPAKRIK